MKGKRKSNVKRKGYNKSDNNNNSNSNIKSYNNSERKIDSECS